MAVSTLLSETSLISDRVRNTPRINRYSGKAPLDDFYSFGTTTPISLSISTFSLEEEARMRRTLDNSNHDPMHRLPIEIVTQIFSRVVEQDSPLRLSSICSAWRLFAHSVPQLWTSIRIALSASSNAAIAADLTVKWLCRAQQLPLSIEIDFADTYPMDNVAPIFEVLRDQSPRWRRLYLRISSILYERLLGAHAALPALEELVLLPRPESLWTSAATFSVSATPALRHLALSNTSLAKVPVALEHLTSFSAAEIFLADIITLLQGAPHLERCTLARISGSVGVAAPTDAPPPVFTHGALRKISLHPDGDAAVGIVHLLAQLSLPRLTHLTCDFSGSRDALPGESICALLARSGCTLTHLAVRITEPDTRITDDGLAEILDAARTLTHLSISCACDAPVLSDTLLARLSGPMRDGLLLPSLISLHFSGRRGFSWESVARLLQSGGDGADAGSVSESRSPLETVEMELYPPVNPAAIPQDLRKQLLRARATGIRVEILDANGTSLLVGGEV